MIFPRWSRSLYRNRKQNLKHLQTLRRAYLHRKCQWKSRKTNLCSCSRRRSCSLCCRQWRQMALPQRKLLRPPWSLAISTAAVMAPAAVSLSGTQLNRFGTHGAGAIVEKKNLRTYRKCCKERTFLLLLENLKLYLCCLLHHEL